MIVLLPVALFGQIGVIRTVGGNGTTGYNGDGGAATAARMSTVGYPWVDYNGNIIFADQGNHVIRKINRAGFITTIAGTGTAGFSGDGGNATNATLNTPGQVVTDRAGNLYICDIANNRVRKVTTDGTITTVAGTSTSGFNGDGIAASTAQLNNPHGIALDTAGNLIISDAGNHRVRKVSTSGIITTLAGTGTSGYSGDFGVATGARLAFPHNLTADTRGLIYFTDSGNNVVRFVNPYGIINTIAGNGSTGYSGDGGAATTAALNNPEGIATDDVGNLFICDRGNQRIRFVDTARHIKTIAGAGTAGFSGDGGSATSAQINTPQGIAHDRAGNTLFFDGNNNRIRHVRLNSVPYFTLGDTAHLFVCQNATNIGFDSLLPALDSNSNQFLTWTVAVPPIHGSITGVGAAGATVASAGARIYPLGLKYTPVYYYSGEDTFHIQVSDGNVFDTIEIHVHVDPLPNGGHVTGADSVCPGGRDTLADIAATPGGVWSHTDTFIVLDTLPGAFLGVSPGSEYVVYTVTTVCGTASSSLRITVNTAPRSGAITGRDSICIGETITLNNPTATPWGAWTSTDTTRATVRATDSTTAQMTSISGGPVTIYYNAYTNCGSSPAYHAVYISPYAGVIDGADSVCVGESTFMADYIAGGVWSLSSTTLATVATWGEVYTIRVGVDTVKFTVPSAHCGSATAVHPLKILAHAVAGHISGADSVCVGSTITMSCTATGGKWLVSDTSLASIDSVTGVLSGRALGTVSVYNRIANYCNTAYDTFRVRIMGAPAVPVITGPDSICLTVGSLFRSAPHGTWSLTNALAIVTASTDTSATIAGATLGIDTIVFHAITACGSTDGFKPIVIRTTLAASTVTGRTTVCNLDTLHLAADVTGGTWSVATGAIGTIEASTGVFHGTGAGIDTILYTLHNSCGNTITNYPITILPLSDAGTITGNDTVCLGGRGTYTSTVRGGIFTASSTIISVTDSTITGLSLGVDTLHYSVTNSCGSASTYKLLRVATLPTVATITGADSICPRGIIAMADSTTGGKWRTVVPAIGSIDSVTGRYVAALTGFDTVRYSVRNFCGTTTVTHPVRVLPLPHAGRIIADSLLCPGTSTVLYDSVAGGVWTTITGNVALAGDTITGVNAGLDTIVYTYNNSCGTDVAHFIVRVRALPDAGHITGSTLVCPGGTGRETASVTGGVWATKNGNITISSSGNITGVALGTDSVLYMVSNACGTDTAYYAITIAPFLLPSVSFSLMPDTNICSGSRAYFSAHTTNGGSAPFIAWKRGATTLATGTTLAYLPTEGDRIHCVMVSNSSCALADTIASDTVLLHVVENVTPVVGITVNVGDTLVQIGTNLTFTSTATNCGTGTTYQWVHNGVAIPGATNATYSVFAGGTDAVYCVVSCAGACVTTPYNHTNTIVVRSGRLGVYNINEQEWSLYPNPAQGQLFINGLNTVETVRLQLTDIAGKLVMIEPVNYRFIASGDLLFSLPVTCTKGTYLLTISQNGYSRSFRIVVE